MLGLQVSMLPCGGGPIPEGRVVPGISTIRPLWGQFWPTRQGSVSTGPVPWARWSPMHQEGLWASHLAHGSKRLNTTDVELLLKHLCYIQMKYELSLFFVSG